MSTSLFSEDDLFQVDSGADTSATDVIELEDSQLIDPEWTGPRCEKCEAPVRSEQMACCNNCGWYASSGTFVELDREWDTEVEATTDAQPKAKPSHLEVWMNLLPWYWWFIIGSVLVVAVESAIVRVVFAESYLRTVWSLNQLMIGSLVFAVCHIVNFLGLVSDDSDTGLLDFLLRPLRIWTHTARALPRKLWFFDAGVVGLAAAIMSLAVIGGLPYDRLLDWGIEERPQESLMGAVLDKAKELEDDDMTMEEAIEELAGQAGVDDLEEDKPEPPKPKRRDRIDCVILGYRVYEDGTVHTLILGAEHYGKLRYAGRVMPELTDKENDELLKLLEESRTTQPLLKIQLSAIWVRPKYTCRVTYTERGRDGRLEEVKWVKMLGEIKFKKKRRK